MKGISIIVCCYNSKERIVDTLRHLADQKIESGLPVEIVLVDNNSADDTKSIAVEFWGYQLVTFPLRVVFEGQPGLTHARRAGIFEARYDFIIFCDDDNWLSPFYVQNAFEILQGNAQIGISGGWNRPVSANEIPEWYIKDGELFAIGKLYARTKQLKWGEFVWGAGMIGRKDVFTKVFDSEIPLLCNDRTGEILTGGGDVEICFRGFLVGTEVWFHENLFMEHCIPANKMTKDYRKRIWDGLPTNAYYFQKYNHFYHVLSMSIVRKFYCSLFNWGKFAIGYFTGSHHLKNWAGDYLFFTYPFKILRTAERQNILTFYAKYGNYLKRINPN